MRKFYERDKKNKERRKKGKEGIGPDGRSNNNIKKKGQRLRTGRGLSDIRSRRDASIHVGKSDRAKALISPNVTKLGQHSQNPWIQSSGK